MTPYGPVINLGSDAEPNYGGAAAGVAYVRGIHAALQAVQDAEESWGPPAAEAVKALLPR